MTNQNITKPEEIWKPIDGYEGYYEVSNHGRVRSLDRVVSHGSSGTLNLRGRILKSKFTTMGYINASLSISGKITDKAVHRLVLTAFVGEPFDGAVCMHLDNNPKNNHISNLRWGTMAQNNKQCDDEGRRNTVRGEAVGTSKLTPKQVREIRILYANGGISQRRLAEKYGVEHPTIGMIVRGQRWKHI